MTCTVVHVVAYIISEGLYILYFQIPPEFSKPERSGAELKKGDVWSMGVVAYIWICGVEFLSIYRFSLSLSYYD